MIAGRLGVFFTLVWFLCASFMIVGCKRKVHSVFEERGRLPLSQNLLQSMTEKGISPQAPVLLRTYKQESELEVWKQGPDSTYVHFKTYPMCRWSGQLGPKQQEGDRQVPEGFYDITPQQMNPASAYYLSFNIGYPNKYDLARGATGRHIMVHGACTSAGCFAMTNEQIAEIYGIVREAFRGGQGAIQMQSFPFRMTNENLARHSANPHMNFWKQLKEGSDHFEVLKQPPYVEVCGGRYIFNAVPLSDGTLMDSRMACPPLKSLTPLTEQVAKKTQEDETQIARILANGLKPIHLFYQDGGQHPAFYNRVSNVSRPDALLQQPVDIAEAEEANFPVSASTRSALAQLEQALAEP